MHRKILVRPEKNTQNSDNKNVKDIKKEVKVEVKSELERNRILEISKRDVKQEVTPLDNIVNYHSYSVPGFPPWKNGLNHSSSSLSSVNHCLCKLNKLALNDHTYSYKTSQRVSCKSCFLAPQVYAQLNKPQTESNRSAASSTSSTPALSLASSSDSLDNALSDFVSSSRNTAIDSQNIPQVEIREMTAKQFENVIQAELQSIRRKETLPTQLSLMNDDASTISASSNHDTSEDEITTEDYQSYDAKDSSQSGSDNHTSKRMSDKKSTSAEQVNNSINSSVPGWFGKGLIQKKFPLTKKRKKRLSINK